MAKTIDEKKKEIAARKEQILKNMEALREKQKAQLKALSKSEKALEANAKKADRVARNRAMYILAGLMLEDMKRAKDVGRIEKLAERVTRKEDKEKFAILIQEVKAAK